MKTIDDGGILLPSSNDNALKKSSKFLNLSSLYQQLASSSSTIHQETAAEHRNEENDEDMLFVESRDIDDERDTITATPLEDERIQIENLQCMLKSSSKIVDSRNDAASTTSSINSKSSISSLMSRKSINNKVKNVVGKIVNNNNKQRVGVEDGSKKPPLIPKKPPLLSRSTKAKQQQQKAKNSKKKPTVKSKSKSKSNINSSTKDISQYKGKIVGLSLPSHIPSDYNTRNKPIDCSVDASKFLSSIKRTQQKEGIDDNHWNKYDKKLDVTNVVLDVCLAPSSSDNNSKTSCNGSEKNEETVKIHMTRNPNEDISSTLSRLQLSIQKKLVVGGKKKKSKKDTDSKGGEDTVILLRKLKKEKEEKVETHISTVELAKSLSYETTDEEEVSSEVGGGCGISSCTHPFYDVLVPICDPWCVTDDSMKSPSDEISRASKSQVQSKLVLDSDILEEKKESNDNIMEGYESVEYDSFTINEMLQLASNVNLEEYALSVPITGNNNNNTKVSSTSKIPLVLESNPPTVTSVRTFGSFLDTHLFVNAPLVITVKSIYTTGVQITWFANDTQVCQDSICYTPTNEDVGKVISVVIIPYRVNHDGKGCEEGYQFKRCVEILPTLPIMSNLRQEFITNRPMEATIKKFSDNHELNENSQEEEAETSIRIVTYNILADQNASRDLDNEERMYAHCKNEHIIKWRRHPLIVHELLSYNPDIISLQEVDTDVFNELLKPTFEAFGYEGYYSQKGVEESSIREGCAIFWSLSKFESVRPVDMKTHTFRDLIRQFSCDERLHKSQWNSLNAVSDLLEKHEHLKHVLHEKLGHVMQTVVLTQRSNQEKVVIGNTHLFYHPKASHIRCMKMLMACRQLQIEHWENEHCPIIFCGDLNSHPNSGVMKLMLDRQLCKDNGKTWKHLCSYEWSPGAIEEGGGMHYDVEAIGLEFPSSFPTFVSAYEDMPEFTHFIEAFVCTLDYILVTNNFELDKSGATPKREDIEKYIAMPNEVMPSDHVSLVADLKWKK